MAAISGGEVVGVGTIGDIYCRPLSACELATDVRRAEQWIGAAERLVAWSDFVGPTCRCHHGGILMAVGRWAEAEEELLAALRVFESGYRGERVSPLVRLAELRVRQGRLEEAERLLEGNEWHPAARRSLATIALARGDHPLAEELARLCFEGENPSDPACGPLLELLLEVHLARGDLPAARESLDRLAELAVDSGSERMVACADLAAGRVLAAEGDERAAGHLKAALERFSALDLPLEAGRARLALARALTLRTAAVAEARFALGAFERLGATRDADAAGRLLREFGAAGRAWPRGRGALTKREREVLSLLGAGLSNAEISERLYISRRTAEHHVARILSKLDLRSRSEAAAYAMRELSQDP
jgi:DNA-binding CsgD family transcriptional regulator